MYWWNWFASILLRIFVSVFISDIDLWFSLVVISLSAFAINIRVMVASQNDWECLLRCSVLGNFRSTGMNSSLNVWRNACDAVWPCTFVCSELFNQFQFWYLCLVCSYCLLPLVQLEDCTFPRGCPFLPGSPFCWHTLACSGLLWSFSYFCGVHCNIFHF